MVVPACSFGGLGAPGYDVDFVLVADVDDSGLQPTKGSARHAISKPETHFFEFLEKRMADTFAEKVRALYNQKIGPPQRINRI